jgi:hypothetical protein
MKTEVYEEKVANAKSGSQRGGNKSVSSKPDLDNEEMMKRVQQAGAPGAGHKALDALGGNWKAEVKCFMNPDGPANVSHGTSKTSWILGGRFLEEEFHGEMMGKPFTGRGLLGFDNSKQKFKSVWVDDVNTAIITTEGKGENGNKVIMLEGKVDCAGTGQKDITMKQVFRILSPDKHVLEMSHDGTTKMEITYTRQ